MTLKEFDWNLINKNYNIFILGKSYSGKSTLAQKYIMELDKRKHIDITNVLSVNKFNDYSQIPKSLQHTNGIECIPEQLEKFSKYFFKKLRNSNKKKISRNHGLLVYEDFNNYQHKVLKDKTFNTLSTCNAIVSNLSNIFISEYWVETNYLFTNSIDYIFISKNTCRNTLLKLYNRYFVKIIEYNIFDELVKNLPKYSFIVIGTNHNINEEPELTVVKLDDINDIKNYKCKLNEFYWKLDKQISYNYNKFLNNLNHQKQFNFTQQNNILDKQKIDKQKIDNEYCDKENMVKNIRILPDINNYKYIKLITKEPIEFKKPKFNLSDYQSNFQNCNIPEIRLNNSKIDIFPSLD